MNHRIVTIRPGDALYPKALLDLKNPPAQLYCLGNLELLTKPAVAIVGTRDCTRYGIQVAQELAQQCATAGICVVSGLAEGIDTAAHRGAGKSTIAVLGNGLDCYYPILNHDLQDAIASQGGLLISEYPLGFHGDKSTFPQRNRIVAALGQAVVAVEADRKSGTLITIAVAQELKRSVFAVPGNINSYASQGTNHLIAAGTARILNEPAVLLAYFGARLTPKEIKQRQLTFEQKTVLNLLRGNEIHMDELLEQTGWPIATLSTLLTNMEMIGLIEKLPGNYFVAKQE